VLGLIAMRVVKECSTRHCGYRADIASLLRTYAHI
jgi:hypothetical protein